jgi:hypothetical protein
MVITLLGIEKYIGVIYRGKRFLAVVWFGASPAPSSLSREQVVSLSEFQFAASRAYLREVREEKGKEPNHTMSRKPGFL